MKIGQNQSASSKRTMLGWLIILVTAFAAGIYLGGQGLLTQVQAVLTDPARFIRASVPTTALPTLVVDMPFENYSGLLAQREEALQDSVFIPRASDFMTATVRLDGDAVPIRMRLMPGPAQHLGVGEKWGFDVRTRQDQQLLGIQRFFLLDPADNNWLNQWAFARSLEREDILTTSYQFVNLVFNGDSWGIYALQEGFGDELMTDQARIPGVIFEFDSELLWRSTRYFGGEEVALADPVTNLSPTNFRYFEIDAFRDAAVDRDELRSAQKQVGIGLLRSWQAGEKSPSDLFDVEKYARFLALVDLWGASEAISLLNLRYYYNPETGLLEPIGFKANPFGSDDSLSVAATFDDPVLQAAYVRAINHVSQPDYLVRLRTELEPEWQRVEQSLRVETDILAPPWEHLEARQALMREALDPEQPIFAYLDPSNVTSESEIQVEIANVASLPIEIKGFDIDGATFLEANSAWLHDESRTTPNLLHIEDGRIILQAINTGQPSLIRYARFHIPTSEITSQGEETDFLRAIEIHVSTQIVGTEGTHLTLTGEGPPAPLILNSTTTSSD